jgi:hypothetical protein
MPFQLDLRRTIWTSGAGKTKQKAFSNMKS